MKNEQAMLRETLLASAGRHAGTPDLGRLHIDLVQVALLGLAGPWVDVPELCAGYVGRTVMQEVIPGRLYFYPGMGCFYAMSSRTLNTDTGGSYERPGVVPLDEHPDREVILADPALIEAIERLDPESQP